MSELTVKVEKLEILPHSNADKLELAKVGEYKAVVPKDIYKTGDLAVYIPEQAILPDELIEEFGLTGKLAGSQKNRVKAVRLRGELSQGIVCRPQKLEDKTVTSYEELLKNNVDLKFLLDIKKWIPDIPIHMSGKASAALDTIKWVDVENIKRYPDIFNENELITANEKIHGTCCIITYDNKTNKIFVTSKGLGAKYLALDYDKENLYWKTFENNPMIKEILEHMCVKLQTPRTALFGEIFGPGVQDIHYGMEKNKIGYQAFDMAYIDDDGRRQFLNQDHFRKVMETVKIKTPPIVFEGEYNYTKLKDTVQGRSRIDEQSILEGVVIRPTTERKSDILGSRAIAKMINDDYLTRKGGTEYE